MAERNERRSLSSVIGIGPRNSVLLGDHFLADESQQIVRNFYPLLYAMAQNSSVSVPIAETLLVSETGHEVFLYTNSAGVLQTSDAPDLWSLFLEQCSPKLHRGGDLAEWPLFIYHAENAQTKVLFSVAEARKLWSHSKDHTKLMQRYIIPACKEPAKTRIVWSCDSGIKRFALKKKTVEALPPEGKKPVAGVKQYAYVGKLQRSSFSPYMPYKSILIASQTESSAQPLRPNEYYWVSSTDCSIEQIYVPVPAEALLDTVKGLAKPLVLENLSEVAYDTMLGMDGKCYLLDVKWVRANAGRIEEETEIEGQHRNVRKRFSQLLASKPPCKVPFIDMHEIQEQNVKLYLQCVSALPLPSQPPAEPAESASLRAEIEEAGSRLDSLVQAAMINKMKAEEEETVRLESYHRDNFLDNIISKVYAKVTADRDLKHFFNCMDRREVSMIRLGFSKAFAGVDNYYFKRMVKKAHEGLGITSRHFARFMELFLECLKEEGVRNEDMEIVQRHFARFSDEVVEDDTADAVS